MIYKISLRTLFLIIFVSFFIIGLNSQFNNYTIIGSEYINNLHITSNYDSYKEHYYSNNEFRTIVLSNTGEFIADTGSYLNNIFDNLNIQKIINNKVYFCELESYYLRSDNIDIAGKQYILVNIIPKNIINKIYLNLIIFAICIATVLILSISIIMMILFTNIESKMDTNINNISVVILPDQ